MEVVTVAELIEDLKSNEEFAYTCNNDGFEYALSLYLEDATNCLESPFPSGKIFEFIEAYAERGDREYECNYFAIFGKGEKYFRLTLFTNTNDAYTNPLLESVTPEFKIKINWK
jgi:hypothetical protein